METLQIFLLLCALMVKASAQQRDEPVTYSCTEGYEFSLEEQECKDINECNTLPDACKGGMSCINHYGGYFCLPQNAQIFISNGDQEPTTTTHAPPPNIIPLPARPNHSGNHQITSNQGRPNSIQCPTGFTADEYNFCRDVNECVPSSLCQHQCYNLPGSFLCQCDQGYELTADQLSCHDVDECLLSSYMCQWQCVNQPGSFSCMCPEGYQLQEHACAKTSMSVKLDQTALRTRCVGTTLEVTAAIPETPARCPTSRPERVAAAASL
ncbi:hypothetical protein Q5P01_025846 [Channa striata]|uniref:EGF-like domain-containing protein n=1 Tax=Channa striata TaxID=64152 RepID=A0AA88IPC7_CHASR|nr:hypothetical protein Q5P01_025846 [Channa striata]